MARTFRIVTRYAEYAKAAVIGRSGKDLHLSYWGVRESRAGRQGDVPWYGGMPTHVKEWVSKRDIVSMVPLE